MNQGPADLQSAALTTELYTRQQQDTVSERLRRWTRNPLGSARRGSNPLGVALANAPAGSRTRGTSMGGLYVTATLLALLIRRPCGPMDKASAHGAGDCRFESYQGHFSKGAKEKGCPVVCHLAGKSAPAAHRHHSVHFITHQSFAFY